MKIGFFTDTYYPQINGVVENVEATATFLRTRGHQVYIFAPKIDGYNDKDKRVYRLNSVRVIKEPEQRLAMPIPTKSFREMMSLDLDIVHAHGGGTMSLLGFQVALIKGIPFVFTYHTLFTKYVHYLFKGKVITPAMIKTASRVFCNLTDTVVVPTDKIKKELERYGVKKPIQVVAGGIDVQQYDQKPPGFLHQRFSLDTDAQILVFVGRLGKEKNPEFLIKAFQILAPQFPHLQLIYVGDGPERIVLEKEVKRLGLSKQVLFTGFVAKKDMPLVYADSDLFVFSSKTETQGLVVAEAIASGLPVVAVQDEAIATMVTDGQNGFLTPGKPRLFAQAVKKLVQDKELRLAMGKAGKKRARAEMTIEVQVEELEKIYLSLKLELKRHPRSVVKLSRKLSAISNFVRTASLVTLWKSMMGK